jgi:PAS domain-containing protein
VSQIVLRLSPLPERIDDETVAAAESPGEPASESSTGVTDSAGAAADALVAANGHRVATEPRLAGGAAPLARWSATVAAAHDACVLLDPDGHVVSLSVPGAALLGCADAGVIGRPLLDVIKLVDFEAGDSHPDYAARIPPLASLKFVTLVRGLLRVRQPDDRLVTVDAVAAPLHDVDGDVIGSLAFLAAVTPG